MFKREVCSCQVVQGKAAQGELCEVKPCEVVQRRCGRKPCEEVVRSAKVVLRFGVLAAL